MNEKCQALNDLESSSLSKSEVAAKYEIPRNTLSTWIKNKQNILSALEQGSNPKRQKLRYANHENRDKAVLTWFLSLRSQNIPISALLIQEKAVQYSITLGIENFNASIGWLQRWKKRYDITFKMVSGESQAVSEEMLNPWTETCLPTLLSNYNLKDIYNADESGLFFQCLCHTQSFSGYVSKYTNR